MCKGPEVGHAQLLQETARRPVGEAERSSRWEGQSGQGQTCAFTGSEMVGVRRAA